VPGVAEVFRAATGEVVHPGEGGGVTDPASWGNKS
jgi:hypothetical protein